MKKLLIIMVLFLAGFAAGTEDYIHETFYGDGEDMIWPDSVIILLKLDGVAKDSAFLDSVANFREGTLEILCTLTTNAAGVHKITEMFFNQGDVNYGHDQWINKYEADVIAISGDTATADSSELYFEGRYLTLADAGMGSNLIRNYSFEQDSVTSTTAPKRWSQRIGTFGAASGIVNTLFGGQWMYKIVASANETMVLESRMGFLYPGSYRVGGWLVNFDGDSMGIVVDSGATVGASAWEDSVISIVSTAQHYVSKEFRITDSGFYCLGIVFYPASAAQYGNVDNVTFEYISPLTFASVDSIGAGGIDAMWNEDTTGHGTAKSFAVLLKDTSVYQGAAAALTVDQIWEYDTSSISGAAAVGTMLKDTTVYQGSAAGLTATEIMDSLFETRQTSDTATGMFMALLLDFVDRITDSIYLYDTRFDSLLAALANAAIAEKVWDRDTSGHGTAKSFAVMLKDTSAYQGATSLTGAGPYTVTIYATDTSGTDAYVSGVIISIIDMAGTNKGYIPTATGGASVFNLESGDYAIAAPLGQGYVWLRDTITVSGANLTDTLWGYDVPVGSPGAPNLCRLYDYAYGLDGAAIEGVEVRVTIKSKNVRDSCTNTAVPNSFTAKATTNPSGYWFLDLIETHCLETTYGSSNTVYYQIKVFYPSGTEFVKKDYIVPDSTSHRMQW